MVAIKNRKNQDLTRDSVFGIMKIPILHLRGMKNIPRDNPSNFARSFVASLRQDDTIARDAAKGDRKVRGQHKLTQVSISQHRSAGADRRNTLQYSDV